MKRLLSVFLLLLAVAAVSGCYYDPGYSYVRGSGQGGDAYYGEGGGTRYVVPPTMATVPTMAAAITAAVIRPA